MIALAVLLAVLLLPMLGRVPRAYGDDGWGTMAGYSIAHEGRPRHPGQFGRGGVGEYLLQPRLFANLISAPVYLAAGYGLVQTRLVAAAFCVVFIFAVYRVMRRLFGPVSAAAISLMSAIDPWVFLCGRTAREEIFLAALLWLSWWLLLEAIDRNSAVAAFLGGLCAGLACWTHPNAAVFGAASVIALLTVVGRRPWLGSWAWFALAGVVLGLAPYVAYVGYVQGTTAVRLLDQIADRVDAFWRPPTEMLATERDRWREFLRLPLRTPLLLLLLWAGTWTLWRGRRAERLLLFLILLSGALFPWFVRVPSCRYLVVLVPAYAALVWRTLPQAEPGIWAAPEGIGPVLRPPWRARTATAVMLGTYAAMSLLPTAAVFYAHRDADYERWAGRIAGHVPAEGRVMAHTMLFFVFRDRPFISTIEPFFVYGGWKSEADAIAHIEQHRPDYLIQSSYDYGGVGGLGERPRDLRATVFGRACEEVAARVPSVILDEFYDRNFGAVRVWQLDWAAGAPSGGRLAPGRGS